jgi:hypothetical protein
MGSQPFLYDIPDSAYVNGSGSYDVSWRQPVGIMADARQIQLQLNSGTNYIVVMSDAFGLGSGEFPFFPCSLPNALLRAESRAGGASEIQQVAGSQSTACLNTASKNQTASQFSWSVSGQAKQCQTGFDVIWSATTADEPYNYTVLPLDQGFYPFDVALPSDGDYDSSWKLNLTAGTRFTVVMK